MMHQPKNKNKTLPLMCKIKDKIKVKINLSLTMPPMRNQSTLALLQTLFKVKHMSLSNPKKLRKLKFKVKILGTQMTVDQGHPRPRKDQAEIESIAQFEMSMMGEMKFFLGFEIKQLREGTFINQAKYLQDMPKRFKMTEMKGVATPMVTKCHLALDPNGGASRGGRRRSRHDRSSDEFAPNAPRKSVTSRRKNKEERENYKTMDPVSYSALRMNNWYEDVPRDEEIEGRRFWCIEQEFIYKDIYEPMKKLRPMQAIDVDILAENNHFEDASWENGLA
ncbi:hypothetical protein QYE76_018489 [Lolium multiflorum]|uniref:Reverse transcriptase Ty1/copia-type domain-containing protein n=1 Tax=Lolium multiflorum TaxID=4521 RepID=A0AAD8UXD9_LOLMU|nr:hypothetical protein QYE76_018489 [Lolium multiflorum]